ncbi:hypothetical protein RND71_033242 [Anisodus tanguticus]|uniref:Uncharacterized protein n=1 Tax=Anisodus tanguticus TaxID=243964 RepID=A0AAE1R8D1_9SOLA|nr:hypothetical protein RND71_033242 [Anisodus tanguticus]
MKLKKLKSDIEKMRSELRKAFTNYIFLVSLSYYGVLVLKFVTFTRVSVWVIAGMKLTKSLLAIGWISILKGGQPGMN